MINLKRVFLAASVLMLCMVTQTGCGAKVESDDTVVTTWKHGDMFGQLIGVTDSTVVLRARRSEAAHVHWRSIEKVSIARDRDESLYMLLGAAIGAAPGALLLPFVKGMLAMFLPIAMMLVITPIGAILGYHIADSPKLVYITSVKDLERLKPYVREPIDRHSE